MPIYCFYHGTSIEGRAWRDLRQMHEKENRMNDGSSIRVTSAIDYVGMAGFTNRDLPFEDKSPSDAVLSSSLIVFDNCKIFSPSMMKGIL